MTISNNIKNKLIESTEFREQFVAEFAKRAFATQVRKLRRERGMSQEELAEASKIEQGVISRTENPNYGLRTIHVGSGVAAGFGLAFIPKLVTFTEFLKWVEEVSEGLSDLPSFEKELADGTLGCNTALEGNRTIEEVPASKKQPAKVLSWRESLSGVTIQTPGYAVIAAEIEKSDPAQMQQKMAALQ